MNSQKSLISFGYWEVLGMNTKNNILNSCFFTCLFPRENECFESLYGLRADYIFSKLMFCDCFPVIFVLLCSLFLCC